MRPRGREWAWRSVGSFEVAKSGSRPVSRVLSWATIHLRCTSPCTSSGLPGNSHGPCDAALRLPVSLFGLAPGGVCRATDVTAGAVRSYRTLSPLPSRGIRALGRFAFCCTFRGLAPPRRYLAPCPVEPGLSSANVAAVAWPTPAIIIPMRAAAGRVRTGPCAAGP